MSGAKGRRALGKGLGALIPGAGPSSVPPPPVNRDYFSCPIEQIYPQPGQPRQRFDEDALQNLVESIREQGIIQPLIVRRRPGQDGFELIAGERRWRASQLAGLKDIPVVVKDASPGDAFEMALVENIQREDLNPIEEAEAYHRLVEEYGYSQSEVAIKIGRNRSTIANSLRLLGLPSEVRSLVIDGSLSEGHARAILQVSSPSKMTALARHIAKKGYSVRETERRARAAAAGNGAKIKTPQTESPQIRSLIERLQRALGARVTLADRKGKGKIEITYTSYDELDGILEKILK